MYTQTEVIKDTTGSSEGELVINVGPQHPATHGVLHLVITLDGETIKKIEPHVVIPTHYADKDVSYEVPQDDLEAVRKVLSMEPADELDELKIKSREFSESAKLVILKRR